MKFIISIWISCSALLAQSENFSPLLSDLMLTSSSLSDYALLKPKDAGIISPQNPALNRFEEDRLQIDYQNYIFDTQLAHIAYGFDYADYSLAFGIASLLSDDFEKRRVDGSLDGSYDNASTRIYANAAYSLNNKLRVAAGLNYANEQLYNYTSNYFTINIATYYELQERLLLHFRLNDFALSDIRFNSQAEEIKSNYSYSVEYTLEKAPITLVLGSHAKELFFASRILFSETLFAQFSWNKDQAASLKQGDERSILDAFAMSLSLKQADRTYSLAVKSLGILGRQLSFGYSQTLN